MESKQDIWPLLTFKALAGGINYGQVPNQQPTYQRDGGVWALEQEQLLIDSVLREIDIPKIYLRKLDGGPYKYEVIDGQQRIRALRNVSIGLRQLFLEFTELALACLGLAWAD